MLYLCAASTSHCMYQHEKDICIVHRYDRDTTSNISSRANNFPSIPTHNSRKICSKKIFNKMIPSVWTINKYNIEYNKDNNLKAECIHEILCVVKIMFKKQCILQSQTIINVSQNQKKKCVTISQKSFSMIMILVKAFPFLFHFHSHLYIHTDHMIRSGCCLHQHKYKCIIFYQSV